MEHTETFKVLACRKGIVTAQALVTGYGMVSADNIFCMEMSGISPKKRMEQISNPPFSTAKIILIIFSAYPSVFSDSVAPSLSISGCRGSLRLQ